MNKTKIKKFSIHVAKEWLIIVLALLVLLAVAMLSANAAPKIRMSTQAATPIEDDTNLR